MSADSLNPNLFSLLLFLSLQQAAAKNSWPTAGSVADCACMSLAACSLILPSSLVSFFSSADGTCVHVVYLFFSVESHVRLSVFSTEELSANPFAGRNRSYFLICCLFFLNLALVPWPSAGMSFSLPEMVGRLWGAVSNLFKTRI
jgi:hypothetical protein